VPELWTLQELVDECASRIRALPPPKNGQVRAVPDDRTVRYYATLGLLDRPTAMRGRTALYSTRHLAQVVAIKRLQTMGRSLSEIQTLWPTLDDQTLTRMSGVSVAGTTANPSPGSAREEFWKREPVEEPFAAARPASTTPADAQPTVSISIELAPHISITLPMPSGVSLSQADVRALRAAAAPLLTELAKRQLTPHARDVVAETRRNV
jgi:DNA-binding transcriptional MerR regulator